MKKKRIGIVGGGQLGLLLAQAAMRFGVQVHAYDPDPACPLAGFTAKYTQGSFDDSEKIIAFAEKLDAITFETERVSVAALEAIEEKGVQVVSSVSSLKWIQDKALQKEKIKSIGMPVPAFQKVDAQHVQSYTGPFPVVQKWRCGGYDGYGVMVHENAESLKNAKKVDSIFEEKIDITKEISVLLARTESGEVAVYPLIEMVFDPAKNLVDYLIAPARIDEKIAKNITAMAVEIAATLNFVGIYAIECFIDSSGNIWVNEIAPRPHNSGHHTVAAHMTSQYEQQIRIMLELPLGSTMQLSPCVLINLLAEEGEGATSYNGLAEAMKLENVQYTLYGKKTARPGRKMGHAVILEEDIEIALSRMTHVRKSVSITGHES